MVIFIEKPIQIHLQKCLNVIYALLKLIIWWYTVIAINSNYGKSMLKNYSVILKYNNFI